MNSFIIGLFSTVIRLTVTKVVFEFCIVIANDRHGIGLTVTKVVFEFVIEFFDVDIGDTINSNKGCF